MVYAEEITLYKENDLAWITYFLNCVLTKKKKLTFDYFSR